MRRGAYALAMLIVLAGAVFALQGLSLLPSRLMYGKPEWIVIGGAMVLIGVFAVFQLRRRH